MRAIDADELKQDILDWENCPNGFSDTYDKARILDIIDEQPTVEPAPIRHGKWIPLYPHDAPITNLYKCSVCRLGYEDDDTDCPVYYPWKYCPHCGALMEQVEKNAEILKGGNIF